MADAGVRQRGMKSPHASPVATARPQNEDVAPSKDVSTLTEIEDQSRVFSPLDILRLLFIVTGALLTTSYYLSSGDSLLFGYKPWFANPKALAHLWHGPVDLTLDQLALFNGSDTSKPIYLAINGTIFDVSEGRATYGPGGGYSVFAGRDATRAFVTGCFLEDRTGDLRGAEEVYLPVDDVEDKALSSGEKKTRAERETREAKKRVLAEVRNWEGFYGKSTKYFQVGKVVGREKYDGPAPTLCAEAQRGRPKRSKMKEKGKESPGKPIQ